MLSSTDNNFMIFLFDFERFRTELWFLTLYILHRSLKTSILFIHFIQENMFHFSWDTLYRCGFSCIMYMYVTEIFPASRTTLRLFSHDGQVRILNRDSRCASWIKIRNTVFWTVCTPNHVKIRNLRCASQITVQRCFELRISQITQRNRCVNDLTSKSSFGGRS